MPQERVKHDLYGDRATMDRNINSWHRLPRTVLRRIIEHNHGKETKNETER